MIRRMLAALAVMTMAITGTATAHDGHDHGKTHKMMGTVKGVHAEMNHVQIATARGDSGFYVDAKTKYVRGAAKLSLANLKAGTRVVVTARTEGEKMIAEEVKIAGRSPATAGKKR